MAVYFITGKLGSGKSLCAVGRIRDYLLAGRRVATNLDLHLDNLLPPTSRSTVIRIPDRLRREDLDNLGRAYEGKYNEQKFGALVIDECASFLNSRTWNDKNRMLIFDWFIHARKLGWDVYFLVQDIDAIDKQIRESLCEHLVVCRRTDRLSIPFFRLPLPRMHVAIVFYGDNSLSPIAERWFYRGNDLFNAYSTEQCFSDDFIITEQGVMIDMRASYTVLSAYHILGRYLPPVDWYYYFMYPLRFFLWACLWVDSKIKNRSIHELARQYNLLKLGV